MKVLGDRLYEIIDLARAALFTQSELAELTHHSYMVALEWVKNFPGETINVNYASVYKPDRQAIMSTSEHTKEQLINRYLYLGLTQLPITGIYQLVTTIETLLLEVIREVLAEFPAKIPSKRNVEAELILKSSSLEELKSTIIDSLLNEFSYKSPKDFARELEKYIGINLLEEPAYHRYIELKATRDIHIHNSGIANNIYTNKADMFSRVKPGEDLPVDIQYFLESYEYCLRLIEFLEEELDKVWPSYEYERFENQLTHSDKKEEVIERVIEEAKQTESTRDYNEGAKEKKGRRKQ